MKEILDFLTASPAFYVATVDENNQPRVRPFSFVMEWEGQPTFVTNTTKKIYAQLEKNPACEICSFDHNSGKWIRISGNVRFFRDSKANKKVFEVMPMLEDIYHSEDNPILVCFYFEKGSKAEVFSLESMDKPVKILEL